MSTTEADVAMVKLVKARVQELNCLRQQAKAMGLDISFKVKDCGSTLEPHYGDVAINYASRSYDYMK